MIILRVYNDGTILPELQDGEYIILVLGGELSLTKYEKKKSRQHRKLVVEDVFLSPAKRDRIRILLNDTVAEVFVKRHPVYLLCREDIQCIIESEQ